MSFSPISLIEAQSTVENISNWISNYKEQFVEHFHDSSQMTLVHPDDCLIVAGPPRLSMATGDDVFHTIGVIQSIQYSETRTVQPLKAIGSRRHIFGVTNAPVQGSITRMMLLGRNLLNTLYANATFGSDITDRNSKYDIKASSSEGTWWTNLEEDVFRIPFGLGIIWGSAASMAGSTYHCGAEYLEICTLVNRSQTIQSGQAVMFEQVSFMADRVVPWSDYGSYPVASLSQTVTNSGSFTDGSSSSSSSTSST